ncbi:zinc-dependent alcohol dehydrogenase family protein [Dyella sp. LX-66]|uniref:zinc-dependent alcohol dehydrogenase family protein n=1 Tax=unclassified Dyella TaxID=2634549 RepID=UPI001BE08CFF|nr:MULTISPECIES: zinc-dependent alcohol dehydrogenase family protein [unclassified Dyella]MBT2119124.1 zinc-dependent alcohol dehydrogenase family protein [Dyella sp. LX-1]MBT2141495.1 zinc-dependent alcohol dehydrogenase family protein [Dyella sp. LX-66]
MARLVRFYRVGGPEVLQIEEAGVSAPQVDEVQIRVKALGINRAEVMYRTGQYVIEPRFPAKLGYEAAGDVVAVGAGVSGFAVGDRVSVIPAFSFADYGMYGELVNAPAHAVVRVPDGVSYEEAAATWMMFTTAYGALIDMGGLRAGDAVLLGAATSSIGLASIQIANMVGAIPIALTNSPAKMESLRAAGAALALQSDAPDLVERVMEITNGKGARIAFDPVGGPNARTLMQALSFEGLFYLYGALDARDLAVPVMDMLSRHLTVRGYELFEITKDARKIEGAKAFISHGLASKALRPLIDKVFLFDRIADAHRYMEAGQQVGKIVVTV